MFKFDYKKGVIIGLMVAVLSFVLSMVAGFAQAPFFQGFGCDCMINAMQPFWLWTSIIFVLTIVYSIVLGLLFSLHYKMLPYKGFMKGAVFGIGIWVIASLFPEVMNSMVFNMPKISVVVGIIAELFIGIIVWGIAGVVYGKLR